MMNSSLPLVAIVGRPNVGKSTLFNRLVGKRQAITAEESGTTRDRLYGKVIWNGKPFLLVDTAGVDVGETNLAKSVQEQVDMAIDEADVIVFTVDATATITREDEAVIQKIRKSLGISSKTAVLAVNKIDAAKGRDLSEFNRFGLSEVVEISAIGGTGTGDLLDIVTAKLPKKQDKGTDTINVAVIGRPNVGKSTLINQISGKQSVVTSELSGTTRDVTSIIVNYHSQKIEFYDTAGMRKPGKTEVGVEKFSILRAIRAVEESDVVILVIDASQRIAAQDLHIAGMSEEMGKGLIIASNKWDLALENSDEPDKLMDKLLRIMQHRLDFVYWAPVVFLSALTGQNVTKLFDLILEIHKKRSSHVPTPELNLKLKSWINRKTPHGTKNALPKLTYATQAEGTPPTFVFFGNNSSFTHFSYKRYLENRLREDFDLTGTAIKLVFKDKAKDES